MTPKRLARVFAKLKGPRTKGVLAPREAASALNARSSGHGRRADLAARVVGLFFKDGFRLSDNHTGRSLFMGMAACGLLALMMGRYAYLSLLPSDMRNRLRVQASRQFESEITLAPPRAQITDRNGRTLAVSVLFPSVFVVPRRLPKDKETLRAVAKAIKVPLATLEDLTKSKKAFAWVKRQVPPAEFSKFGDLSDWHEFLGVIDEPKRIYPEKEIASHIIGFVGIDNMGLEGLEALYNDKLNGDAVTVKVTRDARGRITLTSPNGAVKPEPSSKPLRLSIDLSIQAFAEASLKEAVVKARAHGGSALVMDVETGELLAMASYPTYDLNAPPENAPEKRRNRPLQDALELGSVMKPFVVAKAIEKGVIRKTDMMDCENGSMRLPGGKINDDHPHGVISISEVIKFSSNVCTYKIALKLGRHAFREAMQQFGFARWVGTGLPGEWPGRVSAPESWREMRFANMSFGQGIAISPLQLTRGMAILTGTGEDPGVKLTAVPPDAPELTGPRLRVVSPKVASAVTDMMSTVVEEPGGTGRKASIPGVMVAGKTGTAQKFSQITKSYSDRIATFTGVIPAEKPKLVITVVIDEPQVRPAYGGTLAGPVFSEVGTKSIQYLNALGVLSVEPVDNGPPLARKDTP